MPADKAYRVRAVHCSHQATSEEIDAKLKEVTAPLSRSWEKLAKARKVGIKVNMSDPPERIARLRRSACEQGLFYREQRDRFLDRHAGEYIYLQEGDVIWSGADPSRAAPVHRLSGEKKDQAVWLKKVDPEEREGERYRVYEQLLSMQEGGRC